MLQARNTVSSSLTNLKFLRVAVLRLLHYKSKIELPITYLPHKAVAEVSKDKEPIGRGVWSSTGSKIS